MKPWPRCDCGKHTIGTSWNGGPVQVADSTVYEMRMRAVPVMAVHTYQACYGPVRRRSKPRAKS